MNTFQDINFAQKMYTKISDIKLNNNTDLDFLNYGDEYEEDTIKKKHKKKTKPKTKTKDLVIRKYLLMFILFYILNSFYFINLINKNNLNYNWSLIIRGIIFIILYHFLKYFC